MRALSLQLSLLLSVLPLSAVGSVLPRAPERYDYIVVGGGTAGSVVASRLSENSRVSVLLIEAGGTNEGVTEAIIPYIYPRLFRSPYNWNFTTVPQAGLNGRSTGYLRGHILGGSSSINGMTLNRAPASDWDKIASSVGDSSFSWNSVLPLIKKNEAFDRPPEGERWADTYDPSVHGFTDNLGTSLVEDDNWITQPVLAAAQQVGFPYSRDVNGGLPLGVSWQQFTVKDGVRTSAATAFLGSGVRARRNLKVLLNSKVSRVLRAEGSGNGTLRFNTVEYQDASGQTVTVVANREIIISAGVLATPTLLMRSGLGPRSQLQAAGITTLLDIPAVGQNMHDRCGVPVVYSVNATDTDDNIDRNATYFNQLMDEWNQHRTGRLTQTSYRQMIFGRVPEDSEILTRIDDPSSGKTCPHYEIYPANKWTGATAQPATGNFVSLNIFVSSSNTLGTVTLDPTNPNGNPVIDPKYLNSEWDRFVIRTAIRKGAEYMNTAAWKQWDAKPTFDPAILNDDAALDRYVAVNAYGGVHGVGTARMGPRNSPPGTDVIGPDFKVKGVQGLRVVDTSVFPIVINGHTMGATYIMAEKASEIIGRGN